MREDLLPRFVRIPAGDFTMGADDGEEDERPAHRRRVGAVHVSACPVTNRQYAEFLAQTGHPAPAVRELPLFVPPAHEAVFRELAAPYMSEARVTQLLDACWSVETLDDVSHLARATVVDVAAGQGTAQVHR